jgi:phage shock protein A
MGVFTRIKDMTKASVNELLDKVEDPIVMLNQYIRDMEEEIAEAEVTVAKQIANERKLKQQYDESVRRSGDREVQATTALQSGNEAAARAALAEKVHFDERSVELTQMHTASKDQAAELTLQLREMKEEYYRLRNKRSELVSRAQLAKAKKQIAQASFSGVIGSSQASRGFGRMEEKIMQLEAEADVARLPLYAGSEPAGSSIHAAKQAQVEEQLQQLKAKLDDSE